MKLSLLKKKIKHKLHFVQFIIIVRVRNEHPKIFNTRTSLFISQRASLSKLPNSESGHFEDGNSPSNPWLSWISRGGPVMSWPSSTARRHWCMQMYCCSVWTIHTRSFLIAQTIPKMSTYFDTKICWSILSNVMNVPLRPTPALQWTTIGLWSGLTFSLNARTNLANVWGGFGTPKSGHVVKWKCWMILLTSPCRWNVLLAKLFLFFFLSFFKISLAIHLWDFLLNQIYILNFKYVYIYIYIFLSFFF